jgi:hypothetical protein
MEWSLSHEATSTQFDAGVLLFLIMDAILEVVVGLGVGMGFVPLRLFVSLALARVCSAAAPSLLTHR